MPSHPLPAGLARDDGGSRIAAGHCHALLPRPCLRSLSVGQKVLLRLDAAQAAAVKQQLRALRAAITRG